jgi:hypothetical protein
MAGGLKSIFRAAPIGGINTELPLLQMPPEFCTAMNNFYCSEQSLILRHGCTAYGDAATGSEFRFRLHKHTKTDGTDVLIACGNNKFYTVSGTGAPTDITGSATVTSSNWLPIFMNGTTVFFNSVDTPLQYTGTGNVATATYTGSGLTPSLLRMATNFRDRIYIMQASAWTLWYGASNAITGALTSYDLSYIFRKGGYPMFISTWSIDDGGGLDDRLVVGSSEGEVVVYAGSYPGGADWYKVGHFFFPKTLQRQCTFQLAGDLYIMTKESIISLKSAMQQGSQNYTTLTQNIKTLYKSCISDFGNTFRAKAVVDDRLNSLIISLPIEAPITGLVSGATLLLMNLSTGAWSRFILACSDIEVLSDVTIVATYNNNFAKINYGTYDFRSPGVLDKEVQGYVYCAPINLSGRKKFCYLTNYFDLTSNDVINYSYSDFVIPDNNNDSSFFKARTATTNYRGLTMPKYGVSHFGSLAQVGISSVKKLTANTGGHFYFNGYEFQYSDMGGL